MNASTTTATTTDVVTETVAPAAAKRSWKEFRDLVWAYITFPARKSWEMMCTLTDAAVRAAFIATLLVVMGFMGYCGVAYASFLNRLEAQTAAAHERLIEANTPKSFTQWLYGVTITPAANLDARTSEYIGL